MKKKFGLITILSCTLLSLVSCGSRTNTSSGSNGNVYAKFDGEIEKNVTIKVLENDTAIGKGYLDELINAFNEEYKQYGITAVDANQGEFADLANSGPYGYGPDVLYQANDIIMKYVDQKHVTPLPTDKLDVYTKVPEAANKAFEATVNNNTYTFGAPINIQSGLLYYRKDLLPENWKTTYDKDNNDVPDMVENLVDLYNFSKERHVADPKQYGFEYSINDFYFSAGFLFSYGAYVFGNNNTDASDIGLAKGDSKLGANMLRQFASQMSVSCEDDSAKVAIGGSIASGKYFASLTTPDVRNNIVTALAAQYQTDLGLSEEEALTKADENIIGVTFPKLPKNGDLENPSSELIDSVQMGGINGYAISSYTKCPVASLAFVNFASSYKMVKKRKEMLGIAPCRDDVLESTDTLSKQLFDKVASGNISVMPSISAVAQIWTPCQSFLGDLAADPRRTTPKFDTLDKIQTGLEKLSSDIYDAIHLLEK